MDELKGQVALVTGGGRGIGQAIATALAGEGAAVAVAARSLAELQHTAEDITTAGGVARAVVLDVADPSGVQRTIRSVEADLGPIGVLVNNAGNPSVARPVAEADPRAWWRTVKVHFQGTFICTRAVVPSMVRRGRGCVINIASLVGTRAAPFVSDMAAAKAAVIMFTECLALEVRDQGVTTFSVGPGLVRTAMVTELQTSESGRRYLPELGRQPPEAYVPAERAAELVVRLARGDADALTGRFIHVRDDLDALLAEADAIVAADALTLRLRPAPGRE